jgi:hypothetical protein
MKSYAHLPELLLPAVPRLLADPMLFADFRYRLVGRLGLPQNPYDLFFAEAFLHLGFSCN